MTALLAADWVKLRRRWLPRVLTLILLAIITLIFWGVATSPGRDDLTVPRSLLTALTFAGFFGPFLVPIMAGAWTGNEYGWGTIRMILSRRPNRVAQSLSSLTIIMVWVLVSLLLTLLCGLVGGVIVAGATNQPVVDLSGLQAIGLVLVKGFLVEAYGLAFYAVLAFAAGTIFRSAVAGVGLGIGIWVAQDVARGIFFGLGGAWKTVAEHFPGEYTAALPDRIMSASLHDRFPATAGGAPPGVVESLIGLAIYIAVLMVVTLYFVSGRDVTA